MSAHRAGDVVRAYALAAPERGLQVLIAGAGAAAHLPGVLASLTTLPVIGVPLAATPLAGFDSLLSIVQMPPGIPVATVAVGPMGARNAGHLAAEIIGLVRPRSRRANQGGARAHALEGAAARGIRLRVGGQPPWLWLEWPGMPRLELVETSLRHGQQSLMVSRLRLRHALPVAETLDHCGFAALDVFGGSTFEASLRFLAEDPFERLRAIRAAAPITPLLAVIGGQSLVGHRQVPDDLVDAFIETSAAAGVDIFRCYDPLNDVRNLERCATAIAATGKQAEGVIVYNEVPGRGPDGLGDVARRLVDAGYPTICLHDPLGVLGAAAAARAVKVIREAAGVPVAVSISAQTGMAALACHSAALAGAYRADCALSPLAGGASMPGAEALVAGFAGTEVDCGLDLERIAAAALVLEQELVHYAEVIDPLAARLDTSALRGLLPPSAMGHAMAELRERSSLARLAEVEADVVQVRAELGYPPLITPLTEIMATQAVYNVVEGDRYATVSQEIKDYCLGLYGEPPEPVDREVRRLVNGREEPITCRPADLLEPVDGVHPT